MKHRIFFDTPADGVTPDTGLATQVAKAVGESLSPRIQVLEDNQKAASERADQMASDFETFKDEVKAINEAVSAKQGLPGFEPRDQDGRQKFSLARACLGHIKGWTEHSGTKSFPEYELVHEYRNHLKAIDGQITKVSGHQVGIGDSGGLMVGATMMPDFIDELLANTVAAEAGVEVLTGLVGDLTIPREEGGLTATRQGEREIIPESEAEFSSIELRPHQLTARTRASKKLMMQTNGRIQTLLERQLARKLRLRKDLDFFKGSGTNQPIGILNASAPASCTTAFSGVDFGDGTTGNVTDYLEDMVNALKARDAYYGFGEVMWFAHPSTFSKMRKIRDGDGNKQLLLFDNVVGDTANGVSQNDRLYGHRYAETTQLTFDTVANGGMDLLLLPVQAAYMAYWDQMEIFPSEHAAGAFERNEVAIRAVMYDDSGIYRGEHLQRADAEFGSEVA